MQAWASNVPGGRPCLPFLGARRPLLRCNPCAGIAPQLRQLYCPNSDHAKFFSITQARKSRRLRGASVAAALALAPPRIWGKHAAIRPKDRRIQRRNWRRDKERKNAQGVGCYRSDWAMKLFTGWVVSAGLVLT